MNSSAIGSQTEGIVLAALLRAGKTVLLPFGGAQRYDLALDEAGRLVRVQCKTARYLQGCIIFDTNSHRRDHSKMGYKGFADLFGVYCPVLDKVYLVPVHDVGQVEGRLRVDPTKNNQAKLVRWAEQYEVVTQGGVTQGSECRPVKPEAASSNLVVTAEVA
jgi:hypothetical protein